MAKEIGLGTELQVVSTATTTTFFTIARVASLDGPSADRNEVECTTLDSTEREFIAGVKDSGEVSGQIKWDAATTSEPNTHVLLTTLYDTGEERAWKIVNPTTTLVTSFRGWVKSFQPSFPIDDIITADFAVRLTKGITWPTTA